MTDAMSGRTLLCFWWLFCLIMMATYSGNLIAFLTVSKPKLPFDTVAELLKEDGYRWGTVGGTIWPTLLEYSELTDYKNIWKGILEYNKTDPEVLDSDPNMHIKKVMEGRYVFIADKTFMEIKMANECNLMLLSEDILPSQYGVGLPNNSPFLNIFSKETLIIQESGLLQMWKTKHWPRKSLCSGSLVNTATAINLVDLQSAFYLIGIGMMVATCILLIECMAAKCKNIRLV